MSGCLRLPTLAVVFGREDSKFAWGVSALGVSGFGADHPMTTNLPGNADFDPTSSNSVALPAEFHGVWSPVFGLPAVAGRIDRAYQIAEGLSIGLSPTFNYASLQIEPVPIAARINSGAIPSGKKLPRPDSVAGRCTPWTMASSLVSAIRPPNSLAISRSMGNTLMAWKRRSRPSIWTIRPFCPLAGLFQ